MTDFYQGVVNKYKGSPASVVLFICSLAMFVIGVNHFVEDTYSSFYGLRNLESMYGLNVQIFNWSYATMSLAPQIASMVFFYMYLADTSKKWCLGLSFVSQLMDFFADAWYRGNGLLLENLPVFLISSALTFIYFSIGSELFISVGGGMVLKMLAPALAAWKAEWKNIGLAARGQYNNQPKQEDGGKPNNHNGEGMKRRKELEAQRHANMPFGERRGQETQPRQQMGFQARDLNKHPLTDEELAQKIKKLGYK